MTDAESEKVPVKEPEDVLVDLVDDDDEFEDDEDDEDSDEDADDKETDNQQ